MAVDLDDVPAEGAPLVGERFDALVMDAVVELFGEDLTAPHQFIRVAEAMLELGRGDDALMWARLGIAETTGWQVAKLYEIACGVLTERGDATSVFDVRREQHGRMPSSSTYAWLQASARAVDAWPGERGQAREILRARDTGGFVDALMSDGDVDEAWDVAMAADPEVIVAAMHDQFLLVAGLIFCGLVIAATTTSSNRREATSINSTWPVWIGSKDPG